MLPRTGYFPSFSVRRKEPVDNLSIAFFMPAFHEHGAGSEHQQRFGRSLSFERSLHVPSGQRSQLRKVRSDERGPWEELLLERLHSIRGKQATPARRDEDRVHDEAHPARTSEEGASDREDHIFRDQHPGLDHIYTRLLESRFDLCFDKARGNNRHISN